MVKIVREKPTRCIDPVIKYCQGCEWGWVNYPEWVETSEDLAGCTFESGCTLGFDKGRPEDEPTEEELKEFEHIIDKFNSIPCQSFLINNEKYEYKESDNK